MHILAVECVVLKRGAKQFVIPSWSLYLCIIWAMLEILMRGCCDIKDNCTCINPSGSSYPTIISFILLASFRNWPTKLKMCFWLFLECIQSIWSKNLRLKLNYFPLYNSGSFTKSPNYKFLTKFWRCDVIIQQNILWKYFMIFLLRRGGGA